MGLRKIIEGHQSGATAQAVWPTVKYISMKVGWGGNGTAIHGEDDTYSYNSVSDFVYTTLTIFVNARYFGWVFNDVFSIADCIE
jgi:hypothetical protein